MSTAKYSTKSKELKKVLKELAKAASEGSGFVERSSKMSGERFGQMMVLGCLEKPDASLNELAQVSADLGVEITGSGINQRIDSEAVDLLKCLLEETVSQLRGQQAVSSEVLKGFSAVYILDSSQISLPDHLVDLFQGTGGSGPVSGMKLHLSYEYLRGEVSALEWLDMSSPDQRCSLHTRMASPNSLHLFDLGFFKQEVFAEIHSRGAYFVSRYQSQTALRWQPDDPAGFDLAALLQTLTSDQYECEAYLGNKSRVKVRLVCQRLPAKDAAERRRKAKAKMRRDKKTPSQRYLRMLEWTIFITNVPPSLLTFEQVLLVYRLRWQIEIVFKVWKSDALLEQLGNWRPERVLCQLYARLIGLTLFHWLIAPYRFCQLSELSLSKAFRVIQRHISLLTYAIAHQWDATVALFLDRIQRDLLRFARKDVRKKSPSSYQRLLVTGA